MDLETRAREFFVALESLQPERILALFAETGRYDVHGILEPMDKARYARYLQSVRKRLVEVRFTVSSVVVRRNVIFVEWESQGRLADGQPYRNKGVHILSWDQDGRIAHAAVHTEAHGIRQLVDS
jgi:ketosteroid isomerase-like protein